MSYAFTISLLLLCHIHNYQGVTSKQTAETCKQPSTKYEFNNNVILNNQSFTIATSIDQNSENQQQKQQFIIRNVTSHRIQKRLLRLTRAVGQLKRNEACDMLIAIDEPLYVTYNRDLRNLTKMVQLYVKQLNEIYHSTVLKESGYNNIYFRIKEIRILFDFCTECNQTQRIFLEEFTKMDTSAFCLAHIFTFRDFPAGIQGLAYKGQVCSRSHNTGFTTFLNHKVQSSASDSVMTFAHEVGHNLGAEHDEDAGCSSGYIMSESGSTKISHRDQEFSTCSFEAIHKTLDDVRRIYGRVRSKCFQHKFQTIDDAEFSICGDYRVEGDEECDCGMSYETCSDPCCYAAHISPRDLSWNVSAVPCRRHRSPVCLTPFRGLLTFGVVMPWCFIGTVCLFLITFLCYDWKHKKKCFKHITPKFSGTIIQTNTHHRRISKSEPRNCNSIHEMAIINNTNNSTTHNNQDISRPIVKPKNPPPPPPLVPPYLPPMRSLSQPPALNRNSEEYDSSGSSETPIMRDYFNHENSMKYPRAGGAGQNSNFPANNSRAPFSISPIMRPQDPPPPIPRLEENNIANDTFGIMQASIGHDYDRHDSHYDQNHSQQLSSGLPPPILHPKPQLDHFNPNLRSPPKVPYNTRPDISNVPYLQRKV